MKRMIEERNDRIYINSSSIDLIQSCRKKAFFALERNLRGTEQSDALVFGSALHKALEAFYSAPILGNERAITVSQVQDVFEKNANGLAELPDSEKRSVANGKKIISNYIATYKNDPWVVVVDSHGPVVERSFELESSVPGVTIHGQIDCLLQNVETKEIVVCDHKTSSSLGADFLNRVKPNIQFSIYTWAANQLGFKVDQVMVNGIQVAKTKADLLRVFTKRDQNDFDEMFETINDSVVLWKQAKASKIWPMNSSSCGQWGGCQYKEICSFSRDTRESAIQQIYQGLSG